MTAARGAGAIDAAVEEAVAWLQRHSRKHDLANLSKFGISTPRAFGVSMANVQILARQLGRDHGLALALWQTGWYEARLLTSFVDEPAKITAAQMDRWCRDFDNWAICDTVCFHLFDRTPHAWSKVTQWSTKRDEFGKRASFALMASLALHDKTAPDQPFVDGLTLIESAAADERNFVKKGVSWALRLIGRRNRALHTHAIAAAGRLSISPEAAARWIGKGALRELNSPAVIRKLAGR